MAGLSSVWRGVKLGALGLLGLLLVVLLAWIASNWRDDPALPVPPELALATPQDGSPFFFRLQGLLAPAGAVPEEAGRKAWQTMVTAQAAGPTGPAPAASAPALLPMIKGLPLACSAPDDCTAALLKDPAQIAAQLASQSLVGERCEAAMADTRYVEAMPEKMTLLTPLPSYLGGVQCAYWFKGRALLAAAQGDAAAALRHLRWGQALGVSMVSGSRTLVGTLVSANVLRHAYHATAAVAQLQPAWAVDLAPLAAELPSGTLDVQRWATTESAYVRGTLDDVVRGCGGLGLMSTSSLSGDNEWWMTLACRTGIGYLPNATRQLVDARWLSVWQDAQSGLDAMVDRGIERRAAGPVPSPGLAWRNTVGRSLADIAEPALDTYVLRLADLELHRATLALALQAAMQRVPVAARADWLGQQPLAPRLKTRLQWVDGGAVLQARSWASELPGSDPRRAPLRVPVAAPKT